MKLGGAAVGFWAKSARGSKTQAYGTIMQEIEKARVALCRKKKEVAALFHYFDGVLTDGQLPAALVDYRLPGAAPLATGDFDEDGVRDLVVADDERQTNVFLGAPGGGLVLSEGTGGARLGIGPYIVSTDDVDNDGRLDIVVLNMGSGDGSLLLGNGDGKFQSELIFDVRRGGQSTVAVDLDGNRNVDHVGPTFYGAPLRGLSSRADGRYATPPANRMRVEPSPRTT